jgi:DNA-binding NarL/FixJ family response regulator
MPESDVNFTPRQLDVLSGLARGLTAQEIAVELTISPRTVRAHCDALRRKLGVSRCRLVPAAYRSLIQKVQAGAPR